MAKRKKDFESSLIELETIISELEQGNQTLEDTIKKYKQGMDLALLCSDMLKKAEQEIFIYEDKVMQKYKEEA